MKGLLLISCCLLLLCMKTQGQGNREVDEGQMLENLLPLTDGGEDTEVLTELLMSRYLNPVDLNRCSADELRSLMLLDESAIQAILHHRQQSGPFLSLYELQSIPELTPAMREQLLPLVQIKTKVSGDNRSLAERIFREKNHYLLSRISHVSPQRNGFSRPQEDPSRFMGGPFTRYMRYRIARTGDFSIGFTAESDEGERWAPVPDFFSAHVLISPGKTVSKLALGDYTAQFGQGLVFAGGFYMGKGAETILSLRRSDLGLLPYTSAAEAGFMRGAACSISKGRFSLTPMLSVAHYDAGSFAGDSEGNLTANSFNFSGLHRNERELARKHSVELRTGGINASYKSANRSTELGINGVLTHFNPGVNFTSSLYGAHRFAGNELKVGSAYFSKSISNTLLFGEGALSSANRRAWVLGTIWSPCRQVDWAIMARSYDPGFRSVYGAGFAESSMPENESGIYTGLKIKASKKLLLTAYMDVFYFPWLRFRAYAPGYGIEKLLQAEYLPNRHTRMYVRLRSEEKPLNPGSAYNTDQIQRPQNRHKINGMVHLQTKAARSVTLKTRLSWSNMSHADYASQGMALVNDAEWKFDRWTVAFRYAVFDTDDYDNRQYHYEKDVLYAFSLPAYYGRGSRMALVLHFNAGKKTDFWIKLAETFRNDVEFLGSGVNRRQGNRLQEIKLMSRVFF